MICRTKPMARKALLSQFSLIMCGWSKFSSFDSSRSFDQHVLYSFSFPLDCSTCALISSWQVLDISTGRLRTLDETSFFVSCSMFINPLPHSRTYVCWNRNNLVLIVYWYGCKSFTWLDFLISLKVLPWYASFHWMTVWHALLRWWIWHDSIVDYGDGDALWCECLTRSGEATDGEDEEYDNEYYNGAGEDYDYDNITMMLVMPSGVTVAWLSLNFIL